MKRLLLTFPFLLLAFLVCSPVKPPPPPGGEKNQPEQPDALPLQQLKPLFIIPEQDREVTCLDFSPDGKLLATSSGVTVKLWDATTGKETRTLNGHTEGVFGLAFSPSGKELASASSDGTVRIWRLDTETKPLVFTGHPDWVVSVAFRPDGKMVASGGFASRFPSTLDENSVILWDSVSTLELHELIGHEGGVQKVAFSPDGKRLLSAGQHLFMDEGGIRAGGVGLRLWDVETGKPIAAVQHGADSYTDAAFSLDGKWIACSCGTFSGAFGPDVKRLACSASQVTVLDAETLRERLTINETGASLDAVALTPDGNNLLAAVNVGREARKPSPGIIKVWSANSGKPILAFVAHESSVTALALSRDGKRAASAGQERTVKVWDTSAWNDAQQ